MPAGGGTTRKRQQALGVKPPRVVKVKAKGQGPPKFGPSRARVKAQQPKAEGKQLRQVHKINVRRGPAPPQPVEAPRPTKQQKIRAAPETKQQPIHFAPKRQNIVARAFDVALGTHTGPSTGVVTPKGPALTPRATLGKQAKEIATYTLTPPSIKASTLGGAAVKLGIKAIGRRAAAKTGAEALGKAVVEKTAPKVPKILKTPGVRRAAKLGAVSGAVAAEPHSRRFVKRHVEATKESPGKVLGTTARAAPGVVTAPAGALVNAGITGGRLLTGHKDPYHPVVETGKSFLEYNKDMLKIATSKSDAEAKKIIKDRYGLTGAIIAAPFVAKAVHAKGVPLREHEAKTVVGRKLARRRARKQVKVEAAYERTRSELETQRKEKVILGEARKAPGSGTRRRKPVQPGDVIGMVMEEGITGPQHLPAVRAKHEGRPQAVGRKLSGEKSLTALDSVKYLEDHPYLWEDKHFQKAVRAARQLGQTQRWSDRARLMEFQRTHGLRTVDQITEDLLAESKRNKVAPAQNRLFETPRGLTSKVAVSRQERRVAQRQAVRIAEQEARQVRRQKGLVEPETFGHTDIQGRAGLTSMGGRTPPRMAQKGHTRRGDQFGLAERGKVEYSSSALAAKTIAQPARAAAAGRLLLTTLHQGLVPVKVVSKSGKESHRAVVTMNQAREALLGENPQHNPRDVVVVPSSFKSAVRQMDASQLAPELENIKAALEGDWSPLEQTRGAKVSLVERGRFEEYLSQISGQRGALEKLAANGSRWMSRAILHNPAWAISQVPATVGVAAVVSPRLVRGARAFGKAAATDPVAGDILAARAGRVPGAAGLESSPARFPIRPDQPHRLGKLVQGMERTKTGSAALTLLDSPGKFNRWSEGHVRQAALAANVDRQLNGFLSRLSRLRREHKDLWQSLQGKPLDEQLRIMAKHPAMRGIQQDTLAVIGDFSSLSGIERVAAPLAIFYTFMRMSVKFLTYGLPVKHPFKAALLYQMAQWNADELKKFLKGDPSFFGEWGTVLLRTSQNPQGYVPVPLQRIAPGGSYIPETVGELAGGGNLGALKALNPAFSGLIAAGTGVDPLSGKQITTNVLKQLRLGASVSVGSAAAIRAISAWQDLDRKNFLAKKDSTDLTKLFAKLRPKKETLIRGYVMPIWPAGSKKTKDLAKLNRILDGLGKKVEDKESFPAILKGDEKTLRKLDQRQAEYKAAKAQLDQMLQEYGISSGGLGEKARIKAGYKRHPALSKFPPKKNTTGGSGATPWRGGAGSPSTQAPKSALTPWR